MLSPKAVTSLGQGRPASSQLKNVSCTFGHPGEEITTTPSRVKTTTAAGSR